MASSMGRQGLHGNPLAGRVDTDGSTKENLHGEMELNEGAETGRFGNVQDHGAHESQCLKCREAVKTMAIPRSSAAAMTSASRTEPPG